MEPETRRPGIFEGVKPYHFLVLVIASCGWLFDCMDQRIFVLARESALKQLLAGDVQNVDEVLKSYIGFATMWMIFGWATGGIIFGMMSDKLGRVKTMVVTLFVYSGFTGLSAASTSWLDFTVYRFLVGLGIGGMFGSAAALVAESVPSGVRSLALGSLQTLSAMGNILGSVISLWIAPGLMQNWLGYEIAGWRALFLVGILPSLLVIPIVMILREPESWKQAKAAAAAPGQGKKMGTIPDLFREKRWRHRTIVGLLLGVSGMIGLWGIGFYSPELTTTALTGEFKRSLSKGVPEWLGGESEPALREFRDGLGTEGLALEDIPPQELRKRLETKAPTVYLALQEHIDLVRSRGTALQDVGAFFGMFAFTLLATFVGRRFAFLVAFVLCLGTVSFVFYSMNSEAEVYWMLPMLGFATLMPFGGYSIYFPEIFPTRLRGVGIGFCYNVGRYVTAPSAFLLGYLSLQLGRLGFAQPFRVAAIMMCSIFFVGIVTLLWAPETKGQPLPEDD